MKYVIATLLALLFSCGGGGGGETPTTPSTPTGGGDTTSPPPPPPPPPPPVPVIEVDIVKDNGDRFDPVLIDITSDEEYTYTTTIGRVMPTETGIAIYSDGQLGTGILVINDDDEYQFEIVEEPVCEGTWDGNTGSPKIDCMGYQTKTGSDWYIYYGEDDTRIVEWEILFVGSVRTAEEGPVEPDAFLINQAEDFIEYGNQKLAQSGVFVELKLVGVVGYQNPNANTVVWPYIEDGTLPFPDFIAVQGGAQPGICGTSGIPSRFRNRTMPLRFLNACGGITFLHEMGHSAGLGHGPNNGEQSGSGSNFFFAQGGDMCGYRSDIMQYGGSDSQKAFSNHKLTCGEMFNLRPDQDYYEDMAGSDENDGTSTAYALNRVRYDVSLVHDENSVVPKAVLDTEPEEEIIIID
jgi:hypothetical protein